MNSSDEVAILRQTYALCSTHRDALKDALQDLDLRKLTALDLENLSRQDRRLLDLALKSAHQLVEIIASVGEKITQHFPEEGIVTRREC